MVGAREHTTVSTTCRRRRMKHTFQWSGRTGYERPALAILPTKEEDGPDVGDSALWPMIGRITAWLILPSRRQIRLRSVPDFFERMCGQFGLMAFPHAKGRSA